MKRKEKIVELIVVKLPLWKLFLGMFITSTVLMYFMFLGMDEISGKESNAILLSFLLGLVISAVVTAMLNLGRVGIKFYEESDKVEDMIRNGEPKGDIITKLKDLDKKSFHRNTSERVRELVKMAEVKYDIELLKRN